MAFVISWAIKFGFVSDALKMCSICVYFVTADNWIRVLPVIFAFKSLWYRSICIYEMILIGVSNWKCSQYGGVCLCFLLLFWHLNTLQLYLCEQLSFIKNSLTVCSEILLTFFSIFL